VEHEPSVPDKFSHSLVLPRHEVAGRGLWSGFFGFQLHRLGKLAELFESALMTKQEVSRIDKE
jgi:hypothetical protein